MPYARMSRLQIASDAAVSRRDLLRLGGKCAAAGVLASVGCGRSTDERPKLEVALESVPVGKRTVVKLAREPIELQRSAAGVTARSLRCTHFGCNVAWNEARQIYKCPCHEGTYDPDGRVLSGAPTGPLRTVPAMVVGRHVVVGG
jgi:Rieske Fe-S protein